MATLYIQRTSSVITGVQVNGSAFYFGSSSYIAYNFTQSVRITAIQVNGTGWYNGASYYWSNGSAQFPTGFNSEPVDYYGSNRTIYVGVSGGAPAQQVTLSVYASPSNGGVVLGGGVYTVYEYANVLAIPYAGWRFVGWSNGVTNESYTFQMPTYNVSLTAYFEQEVQTYQVTTNVTPAGGGTVSGGGSYSPGTTVGIVATPNIANGYEFFGWYDADGNRVTGDRSYQFTVYANVTYTARFQLKRYTVSFDMRGHGTAPANQTVQHGSQATAPSTPSATGYTFTGWYSDAACTESFSFSESITSNTTIYAGWEIAAYVSVNKSSRVSGVNITVWRGNQATSVYMTESNRIFTNGVTAVAFGSMYDGNGNQISDSLWMPSVKIGNTEYAFGQQIAVSSSAATTFNLDAKLKSFFWNPTVAATYPVSNAITAAKWNLMIRIIRVLRKQPSLGIDVSSGDTITASVFNSMRANLNGCTGIGSLPSPVSTGDTVLASQFLAFQTALNAAINTFNS